MRHRRTRTAQVLAKALTVMALFGCTQDRNGLTPIQSGIAGRAVVAGACAETTDMQTGITCADRPLAAWIVITNPETNAVVARVRTAPDGTFRIVLAPGSYELHPMNVTGAPLPSAEIISVVVEKDRLADVTVVFDSGVRNGAT